MRRASSALLLLLLRFQASAGGRAGDEDEEAARPAPTAGGLLIGKSGKKGEEDADPNDPVPLPMPQQSGGPQDDLEKSVGSVASAPQATEAPPQYDAMNLAKKLDQFERIVMTMQDEVFHSCEERPNQGSCEISIDCKWQPGEGEDVEALLKGKGKGKDEKKEKKEKKSLLEKNDEDMTEDGPFPSFGGFSSSGFGSAMKGASSAFMGRVGAMSSYARSRMAALNPWRRPGSAPPVPQPPPERVIKSRPVTQGTCVEKDKANVVKGKKGKAGKKN